MLPWYPGVPQQHRSRYKGVWNAAYAAVIHRPPSFGENVTWKSILTQTGNETAYHRPKPAETRPIRSPRTEGIDPSVERN